MATHKVIIDTDPGVDDAMAILLACAHPEIDLLGLTSIFGNVTTDVATRNALALIELAGQSVPVARGADGPLTQKPRPVAEEVHGREGFGSEPPMTPGTVAVDRTAAQFICDTVSAHPGEVVLCPVGPLTNLALALQLDPTLAEKTKSVTVMGGSINAGGNATPHAEANIWQDPHAAAIVFAAPWEVTLVGLDVTHDVTCDPADFAGLAEAAPTLGGFLNRAVQFYFDFHRENNGFYGCYMHDPTAVVSIVKPDLFTVEEAPIAVILDGEQAGQTIAASGPDMPVSKLCMGVDDQQVCDVFLSTLKSSF